MNYTTSHLHHQKIFEWKKKELCKNLQTENIEIFWNPTKTLNISLIRWGNIHRFTPLTFDCVWLIWLGICVWMVCALCTITLMCMYLVLLGQRQWCKCNSRVFRLIVCCSPSSNVWCWFNNWIQCICGYFTTHTRTHVCIHMCVCVCVCICVAVINGQ